MRDPILASWWRSRDWNVPADRIELSYVRDPDMDTPLTRSAMPVLRHLRENVDGQPISVILTDAAGVVLTRLTADHDLERHLDGVKLAPGFSYAEELVGTNGIGTALEGGQPAHVFGHEHYAENLEDLACAGVPIHHPITGKTIGAVDLTCWRKDADPLLVALVKTTADQITQALLTDSSAQELELLQEYLRACRRTNGIVLALNDEVVMMNERARQVLDAGDQAVLLGQAGEALGTGRPGAVEVELPTGLTARMYCRPTRSALAGLHPGSGGVVHVKLIEPARRPAPDSAHAALMLPARHRRLRARCGCAAASRCRRSTRPGNGWWSRASRAWASSPCSVPCISGTTRRGGSACSTPRRPPPRTGWCGPGTPCSTARATW